MIATMTSGPAVLLVLATVVALVVTGCTAGFAQPASPTPDPFVVVRAQSQEHFQRGMEFYQKGQYQAALAEFDRAYVNDPDGRPEILEMIRRSLESIDRTRGTWAPGPSPTPRPSQLPGLLVAPALPPTPTTVAVLATPVPTSATGTPIPTPAPTSDYYNPQARFALRIPAGWQPTMQAVSLSGPATRLIAFRSPEGDATFDVALERVPFISPELYTARLDLRLQGEPSYASESPVQTILGGRPAVRRAITMAGTVDRAASIQMRGTQTVVVRGEDVFVLTALATTAAFDARSGILDAILASFRLE